MFCLLAPLLVVPPQHSVSRAFTKETFFEKVEAALEPYATRLPVPGHLGNAIGRLMPGLGSPDLGHRMDCRTLRDRSPDDLAPGICNRSPDSFEGSSGIRGSSETAHNWHMFLRLAPYHLSTSNQYGDSLPLPFMGVVHFFA